MPRRHVRESQTVDELIEALEELSAAGFGTMQVLTSSDYGDHCHTEQLSPILQVIAIVPKESGYSHTGLAVPSDPVRKRDLDYSILCNSDEQLHDSGFVVLRYIDNNADSIN